MSIWAWWVCFDCCCLIEGLELSFYSGVYGTCIGATTNFGDAAKGLIGISGIVVGIGEIVGQCTFSMQKHLPWLLFVSWTSNDKLHRFFNRIGFWLDVVSCLQGEDCLALYWRITVSGALQLSFRDGCALCGLLLDIPQHTRWCTCSFPNKLTAWAISGTKVIND